MRNRFRAIFGVFGGQKRVKMTPICKNNFLPFLSTGRPKMGFFGHLAYFGSPYMGAHR